MTFAALIPLAVQLSMAAILFCVALQAQFDLTWLARRPGLMLRSLAAMHLLMPAVALTLALVLDFDHVVKIALFAMAISPLPPVLPGKELKAGGKPTYVLGLVAATAVLSIVFVPFAAWLLAHLLGKALYIAPTQVWDVVSVWMLLPLLAGAVLRAWRPRFAERLAKPLSRAATVLLVAAFMPVLLLEWPVIMGLMEAANIIAVAVFVLAGLAFGHLLGGPDPDERTVLALSTATRHPGVAMLILHGAQNRQEVLAAILLVFLVGALASAPYIKWRRRSGT